ncbi:MAG: LysE family transporter [Oscillibacter sp.]|nr:LysE family transporter [Oscillibacter sp.]
MQLYFQGLIIGLAYVAPIGMQNLFVINSALTQPRKRALLIALIVIFFDISLCFSCYFGIGAVVERFRWLQLAVLLVGGLIVMWIGFGLMREKPSMDHSLDMSIPLPRLAWKAFAVTWLNPQALIDGTMLFGSFRAGNPGAGGMQLVLGSATASVLWFTGVTLVISVFSARFNSKILRLINLLCGAVLLVYGGRLILQFFQNML